MPEGVAASTARHRSARGADLDRRIRRRAAQRIGHEHVDMVVEPGHDGRPLGHQSDAQGLAGNRHGLLLHHLLPGGVRDLNPQVDRGVAIVDGQANQLRGQRHRIGIAPLGVGLADHSLKHGQADVHRGRFDLDIRPLHRFAEKVVCVDGAGGHRARRVPGLVRAHLHIELGQGIAGDLDGLLGFVGSHRHAHLEAAQVQHVAELEVRGGQAVAVAGQCALEYLVRLAVLDLEQHRLARQRLLAQVLDRERAQVDGLAGLVDRLVRGEQNAVARQLHGCRIRHVHTGALHGRLRLDGDGALDVKHDVEHGVALVAGGPVLGENHNVALAHDQLHRLARANLVGHRILGAHAVAGLPPASHGGRALDPDLVVAERGQQAARDLQIRHLRAGDEHVVLDPVGLAGDVGKGLEVDGEVAARAGADLESNLLRLDGLCPVDADHRNHERAARDRADRERNLLGCSGLCTVDADDRNRERTRRLLDAGVRHWNLQVNVPPRHLSGDASLVDHQACRLRFVRRAHRSARWPPLALCGPAAGRDEKQGRECDQSMAASRDPLGERHGLSLLPTATVGSEQKSEVRLAPVPESATDVPQHHRPGFVESQAIRAGGGESGRDRTATGLSGQYGRAAYGDIPGFDVRERGVRQPSGF